MCPLMPPSVGDLAYVTKSTGGEFCEAAAIVLHRQVGVCNCVRLTMAWLNMHVQMPTSCLCDKCPPAACVPTSVAFVGTGELCMILQSTSVMTPFCAKYV